jgi:transcriptional regulator with XRE-family HTH domain
MAKTNLLLKTPPMEVEQALLRLGANLKTARLRRNLTVAQVAQKIGAGTRAVGDAEKGKPSTGIATYAGLLWAYGLLQQAGQLAAPASDDVGAALERGRSRAGRPRKLDNDF